MKNTWGEQIIMNSIAKNNSIWLFFAILFYNQ